MEVGAALFLTAVKAPVAHVRDNALLQHSCKHNTWFGKQQSSKTIYILTDNFMLFLKML